ncbi:MAG: tetratricopeptide repeat protein [Gemmataceae bacterium]
MTRANQPFGTPTPQSVSELFCRFLHKQASARVAGFGSVPVGEVQPYEAVPVQPLEPRLAWEEALEVAGWYHPAAPPLDVTPPRDWPALIAAQEPAVAIACCLGNFPQLVRNLHPLLRRDPAPAVPPATGRPLTLPDLPLWTEQAVAQPYPYPLLAVGLLRVARQFDQAETLLRDQQDRVPEAWRSAWANEEAALAWHRGRGEHALALWRQLPDSIPVRFNRGMASLFLGQTADAIPHLAAVVEQIPETSAWHHLGRLYLALG